MIFSTLGSFFLLFSLVGFNMLISQLVAENFDVDTTRGIIYLFNIVTYQNYLLVYIMTINFTNLQLEKVNEFLTDSQKCRTCNIKKMYQNLRAVADIVDRICDTLDSVKFCNTINTVTFIFFTSFYVILGIFANVSYVIRVNPNRNELFFALLVSSWIYYFSPFFIAIFFITSKIKSGGLEMESQLHNLPAKAPELNQKLELILMQLEHRQPKISCGIFVIDWYFLFSCMSGVLSYLVIIVQFELKTFV